MISYPKNWQNIGQKILYSDIENRLIEVIRNLNCKNLSLSGGLDSSYMLYCMVKVFGNDINTYTIAKNKEHPDYIYSKMISEYFGVSCKHYLIDKPMVNNDIVISFYDCLSNDGIKNIIACDGIDEYMCGYYKHQQENCYYRLLNELQEYHLIPLHKNSQNIDVFLPFMDEKLISLYSQIPLEDKVDEYTRKKIMVDLAKNKIPNNIIERRKYGFCDANIIKPNTLI